jgi:hypothetical protein
MNEERPVFRPALSYAYGDKLTHPGIAEWDRRHAAKRRLPPIDDAGTVDPWLKTIPAPRTAVQVDGAVAAAEHLLDAGLPPLFDVDTLRGMWRQGHRDLARDLWAIYADREKVVVDGR